MVTSSVATLTGQTPITNVGSLGTVERLLAAVTTGGAIASLTNPAGTTAVGDVAVAVHPDFFYDVISMDKEFLIIEYSENVYIDKIDKLIFI